jgi:hypothetical protein
LNLILWRWKFFWFKNAFSMHFLNLYLKTFIHQILLVYSILFKWHFMLIELDHIHPLHYHFFFGWSPNYLVGSQSSIKIDFTCGRSSHHFTSLYHNSFHQKFHPSKLYSIHICNFQIAIMEDHFKAFFISSKYIPHWNCFDIHLHDSHVS